MMDTNKPVGIFFTCMLPRKIASKPGLMFMLETESGIPPAKAESPMPVIFISSANITANGLRRTAIFHLYWMAGSRAEIGTEYDGYLKRDSVTLEAEQGSSAQNQISR